MAFFNREGTPPAAAPPPPAKPAPAPARDARGGTESTHIADGSKVVGKITGAVEIVIDGELEGEIVLDSRVVVGPRGRVRGRIDARAVQVAGKVFGNVHGSERIEVLTSGSLEGDVLAPRVVIAEGAFFKGKVEMSDKATKAAAGGAAAPAPQPGGTRNEGPREAPREGRPGEGAPQGAPREGGPRDGGPRDGGARDGGKVNVESGKANK